MSRLSDLIKDLHADEVPSVSFGSLMTRIRERAKDDESVAQVYVVSNTRGMVRAEDYRENTIHSEDTSNYTVIRPGMIAYNPSRLNIGSIAMLKNDEPGLVSPMYVVLSIDQSKVEKEYFELLMKSSYVSSKIDALKEEGARFRFDYTRWDWINVPLPSKTVQQEVVNTLNVFHDLINNLTSELDARKKQYEHYRNHFFAFGDDVPSANLVDIADISRGVRVVKKQLKPDGGAYPVYQNSLAPMGYYDKHNCKANTTYVISAGAAGEIGFCDKDFWAADDCLVFSNLNGVTNKYIYYFLMTKQDFIRANVRKASIPRLSRMVIENLKIPLPSLEEQERIVAILDPFDSLCNDLTSGLPAEIQARTKQYEYYRDKLLSFKEHS